MAPVELLGFVGGGIGLFFGLPQARHIRAVGHGRGVSLPTWILQFAVTGCWAAYGLRLESVSIVLTNIAATIINASVVVALVDRRRRPVLLLALFAALLLALVLVLPQPVVAAVLVLLMFGQVPQVYQSYLNLRDRRASAVSLPAMQVALVSLLCWGAYAVITRTGVMMVTSSLALVMNLSIIALEVRAKRGYTSDALT